MKKSRGVTNVIFASTVVVLLIIAASGFLLYGTRAATTVTSTTTEVKTQMTSTMEQSTTANQTVSVAFAPQAGQMFSEGWVLVAPVGGGDYLLTIYAKGLEGPAMGNYIVEGAERSGSMSTVPVAGTNDTLSEFDSGPGGVGMYSVILMENPCTQYESLSIVYLPGMQMTNATVVAMATLPNMSS